MDLLVVHSGQNGVDEAHLADGAFRTGNINVITGLKGLAAQNEQTACQVGQAVLHSQGESQTEGAQQGNDGIGGQTQLVGTGEDQQEQQQDARHVHRNAADAGIQLFVALQQLIQQLGSPFDEHIAHQENHHGSQNGGQIEFGQRAQPGIQRAGAFGGSQKQGIHRENIFFL